MKNAREYYEDIFQEMLSQMLPKFDRTAIRPSFQSEGGYAAKNEINDNFDDGISGFSNIDNVIYFRVKFNPGITNSEIAKDGAISVLNIIDLIINVYGKNSSSIALEIYSKLFADDIKFFLNSNGIFLMTIPGSIDEFREVINRQIWERHDLTIRYNVEEEIENYAKNVKTEGINIINDVQ